MALTHNLPTQKVSMPTSVNTEVGDIEKKQKQTKVAVFISDQPALCYYLIWQGIFNIIFIFDCTRIKCMKP